MEWITKPKTSATVQAGIYLKGKVVDLTVTKVYLRAWQPGKKYPTDAIGINVVNGVFEVDYVTEASGKVYDVKVDALTEGATYSICGTGVQSK